MVSKSMIRNMTQTDSLNQIRRVHITAVATASWEYLRGHCGGSLMLM